MLSIARKTLNRVPSFQDILQGRMTHPDVYVLPTPLLARSCNDPAQRAQLPGARRKYINADQLLFYSSVDVLVIGAGPTGLGAAKRLNQTVRIPTSVTQRVEY